MAFRTVSDSESEDIVAEINITPLTDIFLVLLIIFMVTSSVMSQQGMDVSLPKTSSGSSQAEPEGVIVTLLSEGSLKVNGRSFRSNELESALKTEFSKTPSRLVILEGDRQAFLGAAIEVMDHARKAGAEKFAIATTLEANASK